MKQKMSRRKFLKQVGAIGLGSLSAPLFLSKRQTFADQKPIRIGTTSPHTGPLGEKGKHEHRSIEIAVEEINKKGGIPVAGKRVYPGRNIELIVLDGRDEDTVVANSVKLATVDKVDFILFSTSSTLAMVGTTKASNFGVPCATFNATSTKITDRGLPGVWRVSSTSLAQAGGQVDGTIKVVAPILKVDPKSLKIAVIHEDGVFGTSVAETSVELAKKERLSVVGVIPYDKQITDFTSILLKLKSMNPDVLFATGYLNDAILFHNQCRAMNLYFKAICTGGGGYGSSEFVNGIGREAGFGIMVGDDSCLNINPKYAPGVDYFVSRYMEKYKEPVWAPFCIVGYELMQSLALIFKKMHEDGLKLDIDGFKKAAMQMDYPDYTLASGHGLKFDDKGQNIRNLGYVNQWQPDLYKNDIWYPEIDDGRPSVYALYPDKLRLDFIKPMNVPMPTWEEVKKREMKKK